MKKATITYASQPKVIKPVVFKTVINVKSKIMAVENWRLKLENFLKQNKIEHMHIVLYLGDKGYVVVSEEEYDNLEVIDHDKPCP